MAARPKIPAEVETRLLVAAKHTCSICKVSPGSIHHIEPWEESRSHAADNLIVLCPNCHARVHSDPKMTKAIRRDQLKEYKRRWEETCAGDPLSPASGDSSVRPVELLRERLARISIGKVVPKFAVSDDFIRVGELHYLDLSEEEREKFEYVRLCKNPRKVTVDHHELRVGFWDATKIYGKCPYCGKGWEAPKSSVKTGVVYDDWIVPCPYCQKPFFVAQGTGIP